MNDLEAKTIWTEQVSKFSLIQTSVQFKNEELHLSRPEKTE